MNSFKKIFSSKIYTASTILITVIVISFIFLKNESTKIQQNKPIAPPNNVLIFGDTHLNTVLGQILAENLLRDQLATKNNMYVYVADSSSFNNWLTKNFKNLQGSYRLTAPPGIFQRGELGADNNKVPGLKEMIKDIKPKTVIISLGLFDFLQAAKLDDQSESVSQKRVMELRSELAEILKTSQIKNCVWIAPAIFPDPAYSREKQTRFFTELKFAVKSTRCHFIEAIVVTKAKGRSKEKRTPIEIDITKKSADITKKLQLWGEQISEQIRPLIN